MFLPQRVVSTLRTARLPADMVAVEQDTDSTTDTLIAAEQQRLAKMKEIGVIHIVFLCKKICHYETNY